ncbi:MAG: CDP-alcohol phosphatidyltransferase family protein [Pseudomonadota bacterium]
MATPHPLAWLPNVLTLLRCGLAGLVGWLILTATGGTFWPFIAFVLVALTDFADGYFARRFDAISDLGAFLDPVADKLLVGISLVAITVLEGGAILFLVPTLAIILRDTIATALRLVPSIHLPVSQLAKWKTALEMIGIGGLLLALALNSALLGHISLAIVWLAALLAIYTLGLYVGSLLPESKRPH